MEEISSKEVIETEYTHTFYCDYCGTKIGSCVEGHDGYYPRIGEYVQRMRIDGCGWYSLHKHLCEVCRVKCNNDLKEVLTNFGFKPDK